MIFTKISQIKEYIPTTMLDISYIEKHEQRAVFKHLVKYLGMPLCTALYGDTLNKPTTLLLNKIKGAIANLTYLEAVPFIDLVSTSTGFGVVSNQNIAPASQIRVDNFKSATLEAANDYINETLIFLEQNINDYPLWNKSSLIPEGIIKNIDQWTDEVNINQSRVHFVNLKPYILRAEVQWLSTHLSNNFVRHIATTDDAVVLPDLQRAVAFKAFYYSNTEPNATINTFAENYLRRATEYLNSHLEQYPVYEQYGYAPHFENDLQKYGFIKLG